MKNKVLSGLCAAVVALMMVAVPVYAESGKTNGGNGGLGNGMGTDRHDHMHVQSHNRGTRTQATGNREVSVYGTGTGSQFWNVNANQRGTGMTNGASTYRSQSYNTNGYRAAATTERNTSWGWLGWLGLLGLFGLRNRDPQRNR
ncbi:WGxxGxxG family protein [Cohnella panacarvi]|uniref:WGxxGxxG family protein n=1 Tax=Cohnella panacarvi TaxID=400776 RepID=UPI00047B4AE9|nr:WGxxGxxG family protein [Cohnella panacarvi]